MTNRQQNELMMLRMVERVLDAAPDKLNQMAALEEALQRHKAYITQIEKAAEQQSIVTRGKTDVKHETQEQMLVLLNKVRSAVCALAGKTGATELLGRVSMSEAFIKDLRDNEQQRTPRLILQDAEAVLPELGGYLINAETLVELRQAIDSFESAAGTRDTSVVERGTVRVTLSELLTAALRLLSNEMDYVMELFRDTDAAFYNGYVSARIVRELGVRHEQKPTPGAEPGSALPPAPAV